MRDEYTAFVKNKTWTLVPRPPDTNIVRSNGSTQLEGVNVDETFSLVVKPYTIQTVLSLAAFQHWPIHQLDVKNAFLHGDLSKTVYMHQPHGFQNSVHPDYIIGSLHKEFALTDLGSLNYFLGISVTRDSSDLVSYSDADWAGIPTTRRSTLGYCVFLGNSLLSWSFKRQPMLFCSSAEAKYCGVANVVAETCWLRKLLRELHTPLSSAMLVYCDNVQVLHVPSRYQFADIFTKGFSLALFEEFCSSLGVWCLPTQTVREC
nr:ribonuclease H-like domain-containing protein [Tanacetum cinerariifolium]